MRVLIRLFSKVDQLSVRSISVTELVLWYLLHVYLAALHWTISSWCIFDFVCGSQTQLLYSSFGVTS
jgi:hypothetical protein